MKTGFSPNFMVFGKEMYIPVDVMMGCPECSSSQDELEHVQGLWDRLEDAYDAAGEHLSSSASIQKIWCEIPYEPGDMVRTMNKSYNKGKCPKMHMWWIGSLVVLKDE